MKRVICLILCGVLLLGLCSCQQSVAPLAWTEETQEKIKRDYAKFQNDRSNSDDITADDVTIDKYFGIYQDAVALFLSGRDFYTMAEVKEDIADIHFTFPDGQPLYIYHEGVFTRLKEAYENGIVSKEDVGEIHNLFSLGMDKDLYDRVREDYVKYIDNDSEIDDVKIGFYFGTYQEDSVALFITSNEYYYDSIFEENVADVHFKFYNSQLIYVYNKGSFTPLREAYESGIVSKEDVKEIHNLHELGMDKELYDRIREDYVKYRDDNIKIDDVEIGYYFGSYQDNVAALYISSEGALTLIVEEDVGDIHFTLPDTRPIYIYHNNTFTPLREAYESGIVSKEDVREIHDRFEGRNEEGNHAGFERRNENEDIL